MLSRSDMPSALGLVPFDPPIHLCEGNFFYNHPHVPQFPSFTDHNMTKGLRGEVVGGGRGGGTSGKLQLSSIETLPVHQNFSCQKSQLERSKLDKNEQINQQIVKAEQGNSRKKLKPVQITFSSGGQKCYK